MASPETVRISLAAAMTLVAEGLVVACRVNPQQRRVILQALLACAEPRLPSRGAVPDDLALAVNRIVALVDGVNRDGGAAKASLEITTDANASS